MTCKPHHPTDCFDGWIEGDTRIEIRTSDDGTRRHVPQQMQVLPCPVCRPGVTIAGILERAKADREKRRGLPAQGRDEAIR